MNHDELINNSIINYYAGIPLQRSLNDVKNPFIYDMYSSNLGKYCAACYREEILKDRVFYANYLLDSKIRANRLLYASNSISEILKYSSDYINGLIEFNDKYKRNS